MLKKTKSPPGSSGRGTSGIFCSTTSQTQSTSSSGLFKSSLSGEVQEQNSDECTEFLNSMTPEQQAKYQKRRAALDKVLEEQEEGRFGPY